MENSGSVQNPDGDNQKMEEEVETPQSSPQKPTIEEGPGSPPSKSENIEPEEECSVCRNEMIDTTTLSDCVHEFCYDCIIGWLTKGSGLFCPMCKTPVKYIQRKGADEKISVEEIVANKEPEATASEDLITEKRIVSRKIRGCRRMMNKVDEKIAINSRAPASAARQCRQEELQRCKQLVVGQLNALQMLRDDIDHGAVKAMIVSRVAFRRLVYERQTVSEAAVSFEENALPSAKQFLSNIEHYRSVLSSFLSIELKALPVKEQPKVDTVDNWLFITLADFLNEEEEQNQIFDLIAEVGPNNLRNADFESVFQGRLSPRIITNFVEELLSLIRSGKTYLEWCGAVKYRIRTDGGGEANTHASDVVTVDDSIVVDEQPPRTMLYHVPRGINATQFPGFFNTVSYPNISKFSNASRAQLCLGPPIARPPLQHAPPVLTPSSWLDLTTPSRFLPQIPRMNDSRRTIEVDDDQVSDFEDDDDIQVLNADGTIVLDDSVDEPGPSSSTERLETRSMSKKRKMGELSERIRKIKKTRKEMPEGLVEDLAKLMDKYGLTEDDIPMMKRAVDSARVIKKYSEAYPRPSAPSAPTISAALDNLVSTPLVSTPFHSFLTRNGLSAPSTSRQPKSGSSSDEA